MHLKEECLMPPEPACPLCSYDGERSTVLRLQSDPDVFLLACPNCRGSSASRLPTGEALRAYYSRYYDAGIFRESDKVTFHDPQRFARHVLRRAGTHLRGQNLKILDYGGGDGKLSSAIAELWLGGRTAHVDIILVDYNAGRNHTSRKDISLVCREKLETEDAKDCDLVLASGILEHIPHPRTDFTRLLSAVRPGGLFYARTPCVASLLRILQRLGLSVDFTYPAHVHDMGEVYWSQILTFLPAEFQRYSVIWSQPSIVETTLRKNGLRTLAAHLMKLPWWILGSRYSFVGGWEVFIGRPSDPA
jgi:SAM-dependent methyltransferase